MLRIASSLKCFAHITFLLRFWKCFSSFMTTDASSPSVSSWACNCVDNLWSTHHFACWANSNCTLCATLCADQREVGLYLILHICESPTGFRSLLNGLRNIRLYFIYLFFNSPLFNQAGKLRRSSHLQLWLGQDKAKQVDTYNNTELHME